MRFTVYQGFLPLQTELAVVYLKMPFYFRKRLILSDNYRNQIADRIQSMIPLCVVISAVTAMTGFYVTEHSNRAV